MNQENKLNIAIVGATGLVGEALVSILEERNFPVGELHLLASAHSAGKKQLFRGKALTVTELQEFDFSRTQVAFFSAGSQVSRQYAPLAAQQGCVVIDNTSHFRYEKDVPLLVPEVNPTALEKFRNRNIIANPNCSTIQMLLALKPLYDQVGISHIDVATYQAVSGSGRAAVKELAGQTAALLNVQPIEPKVYPRQIAFNVIPEIDQFLEDGFTKEEMKMHWETRKILDDDALSVNATCVRVPVFFGHSEVVHIRTREFISVSAARKLLGCAPGVKLMEEAGSGYPTPVSEGAGSDEVYVGRIRKSLAEEAGLILWVVADNVRKGAALNSIQIAELLVKEHFNR